MRMRITVLPTDNRAEDLRTAASARRDLFANSPVEIDPDNPVQGAHRDDQGRAYFELSTQFPDEVLRAIEQLGYTGRIEAAPESEAFGDACQNCGNIAGPILPALCPNCGFRDISPCPGCGQQIPRQQFARLGSSLFQCPNCREHVRLRFNEPMFDSDGTFNQPLVVVEAAEIRAT